MFDPIIRLAASGNIEVEIPSVLAEGRSHRVEIPFSLAGLSILKKILKDRQRVESRRPPSLGSGGSPTASMISEYMQRLDREDRIHAKEVAKTIIKTSTSFDDIELDF